MVRITLPAITDQHSHVSLYAALQDCPSLADCPDVDSALARLRALPVDRVSTVLGWHSGRLPFTDRELAGLPPLLLVNLSLHGVRLTPGATDLLREEAPELVANHRDPDWSERHLPELMGLYAKFAGLTAAKVEGFLATLAAVGIGAVADMMLTGGDAWRLLRASRWGDRIPCWTVPSVYRHLPPEAQADLEGLKFFTDGALGTRTAALSAPFLDGAQGLLLHPDEGLQEELAAAAALDKAVAIHAIGDLAIEQVLRCLEQLDRDGVAFRGIRLEHAQFISRQQARRARDLGAVLSMQPNFTSDSVDYADRLGAEWLARNNPFRMLIDEVGFVPGKDLIFGSDGMPHGLEYAAQWSLFPPFADQRLTVEELQAGYGSAPGDPMVLEVDEAAGKVRLSNLWLGSQRISR